MLPATGAEPQVPEMQSLMQSLLLSQPLPSESRWEAHLCLTQWSPLRKQSESLEQSVPIPPDDRPEPDLPQVPEMQLFTQSLLLSQLRPSESRSEAHLCMMQ